MQDVKPKERSNSAKSFPGKDNVFDSKGPKKGQANKEMSKEVHDLTKGRLGKDRKLRAEIKNSEKLKKEFQRTLRSNDMLLKEGGGFIEADEGEDLLRIRQKHMKDLVPIMNAERVYNLDLDYGLYNIDYTRTGNYLALAGTKGHIAILEWKKKSLKCEFNVKDKIRDIKFLQNETQIAVAQKKYVYIYDNSGTELHRLKAHAEPLHLEYLPYHYLLVSMGREGSLKYHDVSTGAIVAEHKTKIRESSCIIQNSHNGIILVGDSRGQTTMWSPSTGTHVVKMLCHKGSINNIAVDPQGRYLVSHGTDGKLKIWDVRTYGLLHEYNNVPTVNKMSISQRGLLAVGMNSQVNIWKDWAGTKQYKPYLQQETHEGKVLTDLQFVPYEDFLGIGLYDGFQSMIIPGAGEANFDSFEVNIFQTKKQRGEDEVHKLLDKLPADTITLDPTIIGTIDKASREVIESERKAEMAEVERKKSLNQKRRNKMRGRSSTKEKFGQKESVYDEKTRARIKELLNDKLKLKQLEKKKAIEERTLLEHEDLLKSFNPVDALKKKIKK